MTVERQSNNWPTALFFTTFVVAMASCTAYSNKLASDLRLSENRVEVRCVDGVRSIVSGEVASPLFRKDGTTAACTN